MHAVSEAPTKVDAITVSSHSSVAAVYTSIVRTVSIGTPRPATRAASSAITKSAFALMPAGLVSPNAIVVSGLGAPVTSAAPDTTKSPWAPGFGSTMCTNRTDGSATCATTGATFVRVYGGIVPSGSG